MTLMFPRGTCMYMDCQIAVSLTSRQNGISMYSGFRPLSHKIDAGEKLETDSQSNLGSMAHPKRCSFPRNVRFSGKHAQPRYVCIIGDPEKQKPIVSETFTAAIS